MLMSAVLDLRASYSHSHAWKYESKNRLAVSQSRRTRLVSTRYVCICSIRAMYSYTVKSLIYMKVKLCTKNAICSSSQTFALLAARIFFMHAVFALSPNAKTNSNISLGGATESVYVMNACMSWITSTHWGCFQMQCVHHSTGIFRYACCVRGALRQLYLPDVKLGYIICHIPHCLCKLDSGEWWHRAAASASHLLHFSLYSHLPEMKAICDKFVYNIL